jgi:ankyrin repeat protein
VSTPSNFAILQTACRDGKIDQVRELLDRGVDQNTDPGMPHGMSPLMLATAAGHDDVVRLLVEHGAIIDYEDGDGFTAITLAAGQKFWKIVEFLSAHGANPIHADASGTSALLAAERAKKTALVSLLRKAANQHKPES